MSVGGWIVVGDSDGGRGVGKVEEDVDGGVGGEEAGGGEAGSAAAEGALAGGPRAEGAWGRCAADACGGGWRRGGWWRRRRRRRRQRLRWEQAVGVWSRGHGRRQAGAGRRPDAVEGELGVVDAEEDVDRVEDA